jgi:hypothetical protein
MLTIGPSNYTKEERARFATLSKALSSKIKTSQEISDELGPEQYQKFVKFHQALTFVRKCFNDAQSEKNASYTSNEKRETVAP